jgi:hypothetical protein
MTVVRSTLNWAVIGVILVTLFSDGCSVPELEEPAAAPQVSSVPVVQPASPVVEPSVAAAASATLPATTEATAAPAPQQVASAEPENEFVTPSTTDEPIERRRGLVMEDWPDGFVYIVAKAEAAKVAEAVAKLRNYQVKEAKVGDPIDPEKPGTLVSQFAGHVWSQFAWFDQEPETFVKELSSQLGTEVMMIAYSDFSGWQFIDVFKSGEEVEAFHWGLDYSEDVGSGPDLAEWHTHTKVTKNYDGIDMTDQFLFRSKLREVSEAKLANGEEFASWLLGQHGAYFSDKEMAWYGEQGAIESPLGQTAFTSIQNVAGQ